MPTVSEIAKKANVSKSTVSLALNDKPGVSARMRQHVLAISEELISAEAVSQTALTPAFQPSPPISAAKQASILVLHPAYLHSSQVFSELLKGIEASAAHFGVKLRLAINEPEMPQNHITQIYLDDETLRPNGVLIIGARKNEPLIEKAASLNIPCVLVGRQTTDSTLSAVGRDEEASAYEATDYLISLGHQAIAFLGGAEAYNFTASRIRGYKNALAAHGLAAMEKWIVLGNGDYAAQKILHESREITAIIFINDNYAAEGLPVFKSAGWQIPQDLSVICFDDTQAAQSYDPPLTTVSYPHYQEGYWAVKTLFEQIQQPLLKSSHVLFHASLIKRASCQSV